MSKPFFNFLFLGDYKANTGYGTVSKNLLPYLKKHFFQRIYSDAWKMNICAINYHGNLEEEDKNTTVFSALKSADFSKDLSYMDDFGRPGFLHALYHEADPPVTTIDVKNGMDGKGINLIEEQIHPSQIGYDGVFIIQDVPVITPILPMMADIRRQFKKQNKKDFKIILYFPADHNLIPQFVTDLELVDSIVTYNEYSRQAVLRLKPELRSKMKVIPHGTNVKDFHPSRFTDPSAVQEFRNEYFGDNATKFIVISVNRNQPRKDFPTLIKGFELFHQENPNSFLYLHTNPEDQISQHRRSHDLRAVLMQTDLQEGIDFAFPPKHLQAHGFSTEQLNLVYNASDVFLTTTLGEGWGLCVHPSTVINCKDGFKQMLDVEIGNKVMAEDGLYHDVLDKIERKSETLTIKALGCPAVTVTPEHPFLTIKHKGVLRYFKKTEPKWIQAKDVEKDDLVAIVKPKFENKLPDQIDLTEWVSGIEFNNTHCWYKMGFTPNKTSLSISQIAKKYEVSKRVAEDAKNIVVNKKTTRSGKNSIAWSIAQKIIADGHKLERGLCKVKRFIKVDDEFLELIGWYIAEGSGNVGRGIEFSLHRKELPLAKRLCRILKKHFGVDSIAKTRDKNKAFCRASSSIVSVFLKKLCGDSAPNKFIHPVLYSGGSKLAPLIKAIFSGDGSRDKLGIRLNITAKGLCWQIRDILLSQGIFCTIRNQPARPPGKYPQSTINVCGESYKRVCSFFGQWYSAKVTRKRAQYYIEDERFFFVKIQNIISSGNETVMDIHVKDVHSFVGNGLLLHNTVTEAMAAGTPVICPLNTSFTEITNSGERAYVLEHQYPGFCSDFDNVYREMSDFYEVAERLSEVYNDVNIGSPVLTQKTDAALKYVRSLTWESVGEKWVELFKEVY